MREKIKKYVNKHDKRNTQIENKYFHNQIADFHFQE